MNRERSQHRQAWPAPGQFLCSAAALLIVMSPPAAAQDVRGLERCMAEKQMERRTGCLQANVEFLQQALLKLARDMQDKAAATDRELAAAKAEIAALKSTVEKLSGELAQIKANAARTG